MLIFEGACSYCNAAGSLCKYFKPASGLPPHVMICTYIRGLEEKVQNIPAKMKQLLVKQQMAVPLSLDQISRVVEYERQISDIHNQMAVLACILKMQNE